MASMRRVARMGSMLGKLEVMLGGKSPDCGLDRIR
jgi:hypothetical protein